MTEGGGKESNFWRNFLKNAFAFDNQILDTYVKRVMSKHIPRERHRTFTMNLE